MPQVKPCGSSGRSKEYRERTIQSHGILVVELSDALAQSCFGKLGQRGRRRGRVRLVLADTSGSRARCVGIGQSCGELGSLALADVDVTAANFRVTYDCQIANGRTREKKPHVPPRPDCRRRQ